LRFLATGMPVTMLDMATHRQDKRRLKLRAHAAQRRRRECLYCRSTTNEFLGEEHIVPTALGNREKVLPPGVVCRPCNNGPLATLDQHLCDFMPIALMRVQLDVRGRDKKPPIARCTNAHVSRDANDHIFIDCRTDKPALRPHSDHPGQHRLDLYGRRMTPRYTRDLVRALYKIMLGFVWLGESRQLAMSDRFDDARAMILGQRTFSGYLAMLRETQPRPDAHFTYQQLEVDGLPTVAICADLYGVNLFTDLDVRRTRDSSAIPADTISLMTF
jgi:hypothetical protein